MKYKNTGVLCFLTESEVLSYRTTCKKILNNARYIKGPYDNFSQFIIGTSGFFWVPDDARLSIRIRTVNAKIRCKNAWLIYRKSFVQPLSEKPTLLYKLRDATFTLEMTQHFAEGENILENGRKYNPGEKHTWLLNAVWMLSRIHLGSPFTLVSDLKQSFMIRRNYDTYSALARELTMLKKAGYDMSDVEGRYVTFKSVDLDYTKSLTIRFLNPKNEEEVESEIEKIRIEKFRYEQVDKVVFVLKKRLSQFVWPAARFKKLLQNLKDLLSQLPSYSEFKNLDKNKLHHFIREMNVFFLPMEDVPLLRVLNHNNVTEELVSVLTQIEQRAEMIIAITQRKLEKEINNIYPSLLLGASLFSNKNANENTPEMKSKRKLGRQIIYALEERITTAREIKSLSSKDEILGRMLDNFYGRVILKRKLLTLTSIDEVFNQYHFSLKKLDMIMTEEGVLALEKGLTLKQVATLTPELLQNKMRNNNHGSYCRVM